MNFASSSLLGIQHIDVAQVALVKRQLDFRAHAHSPPYFSKFWAIVFETFEFDALVEHHPLSGHSEHDFQLAGAWRQRGR